jgi:hypothetical protein
MVQQNIHLNLPRCGSDPGGSHENGKVHVKIDSKSAASQTNANGG